MFTKFWKLSQWRFITGHFSHHGFGFYLLRRKMKKHGRLGAYVITPQILAIGFVILIRCDTRNQIFIIFMAKTWILFVRILKVKIGSSCFILWKSSSSNTMVLFTHCDVVWAAVIAFRAHRCYTWFAGDCNFRKSVYILGWCSRIASTYSPCALDYTVRAFGLYGQSKISIES